MFLSCKDVSRLSTEYLEHQLDWSLKLKIRFHILICGYCRKFIRHMDTMHQYVYRQQKLNYLGGKELDAKVDKIMSGISHSSDNDKDSAV